MSGVRKSPVLLGVLLGAFLSPSISLAWDGQVTGVPFQIDVTDGANFGLRVYLTASPMCGTSVNWAYLNSQSFLCDPLF